MSKYLENWRKLNMYILFIIIVAAIGIIVLDSGWNKYCQMQNEEWQKLCDYLNKSWYTNSMGIQRDVLKKFTDELSSRIGDATTDVQGCRNLIKDILNEYIKEDENE